MIQHRRATGPVLAAAVAVTLGGCATTIRDDRPAGPSWRSPNAPAPAVVAPDGRITAYVASFGLSERVAARHPELLEARAGLGIAQRIAEALYDSGRFRFLEEKAEMAARLAEFRARSGGAGAPAEARWLLYGELLDVQVARDEGVAGFAARAEETTRATVQVRLVERDGGRYFPATATGSAPSTPGGGGVDGGPEALDPRALAAATGEAVRAAAAELVLRLEGR